MGISKYMECREKWLKSLKAGSLVWCAELGRGGCWKAQVNDVTERNIEVQADAWRTVTVDRQTGMQRDGTLRIYQSMPRNIMSPVQEVRAKSY